jgi:integrase
VKTHKPQNIPIHEDIEKELRELIKLNGEGYVFARHPRAEKPIGRDAISQSLSKALETIGIDEARRKKRNLTFHGWRHFFNTYLLMENVANAKVMAVTGHVAEKMKKHYTHFDTTKFSEVIEAQKRLMEHQSREKAVAGAGRNGSGVI